MKHFERTVTELLDLAGVSVNGHEAHDITVHDRRFFERFLLDGRMGLGESYVDGWWDCERVDELLLRLITARERIVSHVKTPRTILRMLAARLAPHGNTWRSKEIGEFHYDVGNELFERILDSHMNYSCGYWRGGARTLEEAQRQKMDRICRKLKLEPGMRLLDIGCGWGGFAKFAAENYGVRVTGVSISKEQVKYAEELCRGLPVDFQLCDYREIEGVFDRISAIGMFEHVGRRYYRTFMEQVASRLTPDGIFLLHTIGFNTSDFNNPWLQKYIFPGCFVPSLKHVGDAYEDLMVLEHVENIGYDYAPTLLAWYDKLVRHWPELVAQDAQKYDERFLRIWQYYLLSCVAGFKARKIQLWQFAFGNEGVQGGYSFVETRPETHAESRPVPVAV